MKKLPIFHIFLADDHAMLRDGLRALVNAQADMAVVGEAGDGHETVRLARTLQPDVVVMDVTMPKLNGIEATRQLKRAWPGAKVLALTAHDSVDYLRQLVQAGVVGYVLKRSAADVLLTAIRQVAQGGVHFDPTLMYQSVNAFLHEHDRQQPVFGATLSERETEVLRLLGQGHTAKEAAACLNLSVKTVETYKARLMEKLKLTSRVDLVRYTHERGLAAWP